MSRILVRGNKGPDILTRWSNLFFQLAAPSCFFKNLWFIAHLKALIRALHFLPIVYPLYYPEDVHEFLLPLVTKFIPIRRSGVLISFHEK